MAYSSKYGSQIDSLVKLARECIQDAWEYDKDNRREAARDLSFLAGDQWPLSVRQQREREGRPVLTINRLPQFVHQVVNDIRQADLAIKVVPVDDRTDPDLAKIYNGLLRLIQTESSATHVYGAACAHQVACGIGWWRIVSVYPDDLAWDQELRIKLVPNPLSVYCDPAAREPDRSDAMWIAVTELIPRKAFKERYPKATAPEGVDVPAERADSGMWWANTDFIRIAEFWRKVPVKRRLGLTADGQTIDLTDIPPSVLPLLGLVREKEVESYRVEQFVCSGIELLSEVTKWPGCHIPIVPVIGDEIPLERMTWRGGLIRHARDPQQMYNYIRSAVAEHIALAPKAPYLVTAKQIERHKALWDTHNRYNLPYLIYDGDPTVPGPPKREDPPQTPAALINEAQIAVEDMKATTGIYDASLGARSNERSGRAILARQREGDTANYHYADNLRRALEHTGRILIDLIPKIYDSERVIRLMNEDGSEETVRINHVLYGMDGRPVMINDLSAGKFDVRVSIGPSYTTKRMEAADSMLAFLQAYPAAAPVIGDLIAKNMDWPGADEIAKRLRNLLRAQAPQVLASEEDQFAPQLPDPMDDPALQLELAGKEAEVRKKQAEAARAEAENIIDFGLGRALMQQPQQPSQPAE